MNCPVPQEIVTDVEVMQLFTLGDSAVAFAGVTPSGDETRLRAGMHWGGDVTVTPVHVSATYTC